MQRLIRLCAAATPVLAVCEPAHVQGTAAQEPVPRSALRLVHVQVFFRHGARTPVNRPPGQIEEVSWHEEAGQHAIEDAAKLRILQGGGPPGKGFKALQPPPQNAMLPGGCSLGTLTSVGKMNARDLGAVLRERYVATGFVGATYSPTDVYVRSTDFHRTIMSVRHKSDASCCCWLCCYDSISLPKLFVRHAFPRW
eukprot:m.59214 g.59214  ORF g.59214 m.59214 type:complete len:196 (-) comp6949_c0_seq1:1141-1728(-)